MITQKVSPVKIKPWQGFLLVLAIAFILFAASTLMGALAMRTGNPLWSQISIILLAGLSAWYLMRNYILEFQYTVNEGVFYIERLYGQRTKVVLQLPLSDILFLGTDKEAAAKWPQARIMVNAALKKPLEPMEKMCIAYRKDGQVHLALLQPDEQMKKAIFDQEKRAREAQEKWG